MINLTMAEPDNILRPRLSVIGVGGAGGNAINNMIRSNLEGCDFIAANTDAQALAQSLAGRKMQLGVTLSRGLGAGSRPEVGRAAAEEQLPEIMAVLEGSDMLFVTAGMGGGTGTGAAPVIARAARESGILTVGVVTKPFHFEGNQRMKQAEMGIAELQQYVDTLIVIPNQNLFRIANERTTFAEAFRLADEVLHSGVRGITDLMVMPGFMNLDFADVKTVMGEMGKAMMGTGEAEGDNRAICAAEAAISNPLLDDISMKGARGVLINITGGLDMTLFEVDQAANRIREEVDPEAQIKVGSTLNEALEGRIRVSVIATGIDAELEMQLRQQGSQGTQAPTVSIRTSVAPQETTRRLATPAMPVSTPIAKTAALPTPAPTPATPPTSGGGYFGMASPIPSHSTSSHVQPETVHVTSAATPAMPSMVEEMIEEAPKYQPTVASVQSRPALEPVPMAQQAYSPTPAQQRTNVTQSPLRQPAATQPPAATLRAPQPAVSPTTTSANARPVESKPAEMRVTQLTANATQAAAAPQTAQTTNHRSQSLFQRITGFGMVRPSSAARDAEEALNETAEAAGARLNVSPDDRPSLSTSSGDQTDLLDIPAFLRRQTNH